MDVYSREVCLEQKIYQKIPHELIYKILFQLKESRILITTYYYEAGFVRNFTYLDGVSIDYENKNPGPPPYSQSPPKWNPCMQGAYLCSDGVTYIYPDPITCNYPYCPGTKSPSYSSYSWTVIGIPVLSLLGIGLLGALIFFIILKRYRQKQALQGINEVEMSNPASTSGGTNYFMRSNAQPFASTHPVYLYQPNSSVMTNGPVPMGYVPVMQTNAPQMSSDEIYARELQTKFDQGY